VAYILVTNDDGVDSPALLPLIRAIQTFSPVRVVCPARERSWIGKAISRWEDIAVEPVVRGGIEVHAVHGFPADCTNLAVHSLFEEPPEMVVSGVNVGLNTGLGFFLSSGTVGAAMEAWIAGIPAFAFSVGRWSHDPKGPAKPRASLRTEVGDLWDRVAAISGDIVRRVRELGFPHGVDLLNVNFPVEAGLDTPRVVSRLAQVGYQRLFRPKGEGVYVHDYTGEIRANEPLDGTDVGVVKKGWVSITPVRLAHTVGIPPVFQKALRARSE
jgi:5'-nucleotidase